MIGDPRKGFEHERLARAGPVVGQPKTVEVDGAAGRPAREGDRRRCAGGEVQSAAGLCFKEAVVTQTSNDHAARRQLDAVIAGLELGRGLGVHPDGDDREAQMAGRHARRQGLHRIVERDRIEYIQPGVAIQVESGLVLPIDQFHRGQRQPTQLVAHIGHVVVVEAEQAFETATSEQFFVDDDGFTAKPQGVAALHTDAFGTHEVGRAVAQHQRHAVGGKYRDGAIVRIQGTDFNDLVEFGDQAVALVQQIVGCAARRKGIDDALVDAGNAGRQTISRTDAAFDLHPGGGAQFVKLRSRLVDAAGEFIGPRQHHASGGLVGGRSHHVGPGIEEAVELTP